MTAGMTPENPPIGDSQPGAGLRVADQLQSAGDDYRHFLKTAFFIGTDEAQTVEATVTGDRRLTGLNIEHGLLRLGAEVVQQRLNEAVRNAQAAASEAVGGEGEKLLKTMGFTDQLMEQLSVAVANLESGQSEFNQD